MTIDRIDAATQVAEVTADWWFISDVRTNQRMQALLIDHTVVFN
jgi:hypothetical protein